MDLQKYLFKPQTPRWGFQKNITWFYFKEENQLSPQHAQVYMFVFHRHGTF